MGVFRDWWRGYTDADYESAKNKIAMSSDFYIEMTTAELRAHIGESRRETAERLNRMCGCDPEMGLLPSGEVGIDRTPASWWKT